MPLCLQADVEKVGQVDFTAEPEPAVDLWIDMATEAIETYCGRQLAETAGQVETLEGSSTSILRLAGYPVTAVNSVTEDGTALVEGTDFIWYPDGRLVRSVSGDYDLNWHPKRQSIVVNYDFGYSTVTVPDDLRHVCASIVLRIYQAGEVWANSPTGTAGNLVSLSLEGSGSAAWESGTTVTIGNVPLITSYDTMILQRYWRRI